MSATDQPHVDATTNPIETEGVAESQLKQSDQTQLDKLSTEPNGEIDARQDSFAQILSAREGGSDEKKDDSTAVSSSADTQTQPQTPAADISAEPTTNGASESTSTSTGQDAVEESPRSTKKKKKKKKKRASDLGIMALMGGGGLPKKKKKKNAAPEVPEASTSEDEESKASARSAHRGRYKKQHSPTLESSLASKKRRVDISVSSDEEKGDDSVDVERKKAAERRKQKEQERIESVKALIKAPAAPATAYVPTQDKDIQQINLRGSSILTHQLQSLVANDDECDDNITLHMSDIKGEVTPIRTQRVVTFEGTYEVFNEYYATPGQTQIVFWRIPDMEPVQRFLSSGAGDRIIYSSDTPHKLRLGSGPEYTIYWREHPKEWAEALLETKYQVSMPKPAPMSEAEAMRNIGITAKDLEQAEAMSGSMPAQHDSSMISIRVRDGRNGQTITLKFKKTDPISKLHEYYCKKQGLALSNVSLKFDGDTVQGNDTADKLELEDDDLIDAQIT